MRMRRLAAWMLSVAALAACLTAPAGAAAKINSFTQLCSGNISFTVVDISQPLMPGSQSCSFSLDISTNANQGSVTLTAPAITGSTGSIPQGAFHAVCTATTNPGGIFTSSGTVQLSSTAVTCGTISSNQTNQTIVFSVTLYLDDTGDATAFPADPTYKAANLAVTANAP